MELTEQQKQELQTFRRNAIVALQSEILQSPHSVGPESCPVKHQFAPGVYIREITMPEGMVVIGKIHKHAHANVLSAGVCAVFTEHDGLEILEAPRTWVSKPGTKRAVLVLESAVWTTIHRTDLTDIDAIEDEIIQKEIV
jgi:hypothetical protein